MDSRNFIHTMTTAGIATWLVASATLAAPPTVNWDAGIRRLTIQLPDDGSHVEISHTTQTGLDFVSVKSQGADIVWPGQGTLKTKSIRSIRVRGGEGDDVIDLSGVSDKTKWNRRLNENIVLIGGPGNDVIKGSVFDDRLVGRAGHDIFYGGEGKDHGNGLGGKDHFLDFDSQEDTMTSCAGVSITIEDRMLVVAAAPSSTNGLDLALASDATNLHVKLAGHAIDEVPLADLDKLHISGSSLNDVLDCQDVAASLEFCEIHGGAGVDTIHGTKGRDRIFGGPGNDLVHGHDGDDYVIDYHQQNDRDRVTDAKGLTNIWHWKAGDITKSRWDEFFRPRPDLHESKRKFHYAKNPDDPRSINSIPKEELVLVPRNNASDSFLWLDPNQSGRKRIAASSNRVVPRMLADGRLEAYVRNKKSHGVMFPFFADRKHLEQGRYCIPNQRYRYKFSVELPDEPTWDELDWTVICQIFNVFPGPTDIPNWQGSKSPELAVYVIKRSSGPSIWVRAWGCTDPNNTGYNTETMGVFNLLKFH